MNILISGADRGLGYGLAESFLKDGHTVFAGTYLTGWNQLLELKERYQESLHLTSLDVTKEDSIRGASVTIKEQAGCLDLLISNAGINGKQEDEIPMESDYGHMMRTYDVNAVGAVRLVEGCCGLMEQSSVKRICFVSSEAGSITQSKRNDNFAYCMSKAALNMYAKLIYNRLHPLGYDIRLYHPGWIKSYMRGYLSQWGDLTIEEAAGYAKQYFMDKEAGGAELFLYGYDGEKFQF